MKAGIVECFRVQSDQRRRFCIGMDQVRFHPHRFRRHFGIEIAGQKREGVFGRGGKGPGIHPRYFPRFSAWMQFSSSPKKRERSCLLKPAL